MEPTTKNNSMTPVYTAEAISLLRLLNDTPAHMQEPTLNLLSAFDRRKLASLDELTHPTPVDQASETSNEKKPEEGR